MESTTYVQEVSNLWSRWVVAARSPKGVDFALSSLKSTKMPFTISWEPKGVYCKLHGVVSIEEVRQMVDAVVHDPRFHKLQFRVTDCLDVTQHDVSHGDIDTTVAMNHAYSFANARKYEAAIATDDAVLSLLRHWASSSPRQQQLCIFSTQADARKWLSHPDLI